MVWLTYQMTCDILSANKNENLISFFRILNEGGSKMFPVSLQLNFWARQKKVEIELQKSFCQQNTEQKSQLKALCTVLCPMQRSRDERERKVCQAIEKN